MKWLSIFLLFSALSTPVFAQDMSAAEFETYTNGKTLFFGRDGKAYGAEEYLGNRRVRWSFLDGQCKEGYWYEDNSQICFVYEDRPDPQCWAFQKGPSGLIARFINDPGSTDLYEAQELGDEMVCLGPKVGV
ncbi:MAG: hypothetical protein ABJH45_26940 [Paracoccaceae bacterium]